jgi:UMF1 family MFS transporter
MASTTGSPQSTRRERWAWYLYDFGNSAYASVVLLAVYAVYFQGKVVGGAQGSLLWGLAVGIAMLVVAISAPILGTLADFSGSKKRFLLFYTIMSCLFTALLFFTQPGTVLIGMLFFILAEIGYRSAQVFYDALLPEIAGREEMGRVGGTGWAIGSAGGIVVLLLILPPLVLTKNTWLDPFGSPWMARIALLVAAGFFALSSVPLFLWVRERAQPQPMPAGESFITVAFKRLWRTFREARRFREFVKFFVAFLVYNDGIIMTLDFAAILGAVLFGMDQQTLIIFFIVVQATNVVGSYIFGWLADRLSCKRSLLLAISILIGTVVWLYFTQSLAGYFVVGAVAGFAMAGAQAVSRSMVGAISPAGQSAEFFGFFAMAGRTSSFIGPAVFGWAVALANNWYKVQGLAQDAANQAGHRLALFAIVAFLLVGMLLLLLVNERRARTAALTEYRR